MLSESAVTPSSDLTTLTVSQLARRIADRELTSCEAVEAHIAQIERVNPRLRAVSQPLFEQARDEAQAADAITFRLAKSDELPPLHGVPVTVKDCFDVAGTDCTLGISSRVGHPSGADAPLVARLRAAGAIILGKTNTHQGMLLHEANNPVFGRTNHPLSSERTPGGSSGGEAAIVAAFGSPLGLASDLGGSIRHPAHSCGLCGLKPSSGRLSAYGSYRAMPGMRAIALQPGPIARSVEDVDLAMRVLMDKSLIPRQEDEASDPWPNYREVALDGLRIGWFDDDGYFRPAPAARRAVGEAAQALRQRGATVVQFMPPDVRDMMRIYTGLVTSDGLASLRRMVRGDRLDPQVRRQLLLGAIPRSARRLLKGLLYLIGERYLAEMVWWTGRRPVSQYWDLSVEVDLYRQKFMRATELAPEAPLDAIILPAHGLPALRHNTALDVLPAASYCFLPNLLGWPAGVVPFTTVKAAEESDRAPQHDRVVRIAREVEHGSQGLPIGVQVLARPWREDVVLAVMKALELNSWESGATRLRKPVPVPQALEQATAKKLTRPTE